MTPDNVIAVFDALSAKLAVPTEKFLSIVPRIGAQNYYIAAICLAIIGIILLIGAVYAYKEGEPAIMLLALFVCIFPMVFLLAFLPDAILWAKDPEAWAVKYLIDMLKATPK